MPYNCLFLEKRHIIIVCSIRKDRVSIQRTEVVLALVHVSDCLDFLKSQLAQLPVGYSHLKKLKWSITPHNGAYSSFYVPHYRVLRSGVPRNFVRSRRGGGSTNSVEDRCRENGNLGVVAPDPGFPLSLQMSETIIFIKLLRMYFPRNWGFGSSLSKLRNLGGGGVLNPTKHPSVRHWFCAMLAPTYFMRK
jgi:hypothetical protein